LNYLISKITVNEIMTKQVLTVTEDTPIEEAARIMADNKIGGLPVVRNNHIVGIITETDLFKIFLELMGARYSGVRVTVLVREQRGQLAKLSQAISNVGGNFVAFGMFQAEDPANRMVTFKVDGLSKDQVKAIVEPIVESIVDIRDSKP
jgi:acetoin utilization protein AcuB